MSSIHYFQRYSSKENTITNNTLLLLARIYDYSRIRANQLLKEIFNQQLEIGLQISQQSRGVSQKNVDNKSIPDGVMKQQSFKIIIEAKDGSSSSLSQLEEHAKHFENEDLKILILLTKNSEKEVSHEFTQKLEKNDTSRIFFKNVTYKDLCDCLEKLFEPHEAEIVELVEDYIEYCFEEGLIDKSQSLMRVVPCGDSLALNLKYSLYHMPRERSFRDHKFIGCYSKKCVKAILRVDSEYTVENSSQNLLNIECVRGESSQKHKETIEKFIRDPENPFKEAEPLRFFLGEIAETNFVKKSKGGMMSSRYFDLCELLQIKTVPQSLSEIAKALKGMLFD